MYKLANSARKAMQDKAKRLTTADPHQKVDSSTWSPAEPLDTEAKTGARPLVRRIYKSGGKVQGGMAKKRADRTARKSGGRTAPWVDDLINRDVRTANEAREGKKHVGAFKKGGRTKHADGGKPKYDPYKDVGSPLSPEQEAMIKKGKDPYQDRFAPTRTTPERAPSKRRVPMPVPRPSNMKKGGEAGHPDVALDKALIKKMIKPSAMKEAKCYGGKAKKADGGKTPSSQPNLDTLLEAVKNNSFGPKAMSARKNLLNSGWTDDKIQQAISASEQKLGRTKNAKGGKTKKAGGGMLEASKKAMLVAADPHMKGAKKMTPEPVQKPEDQKKAKGGSVFSGNSTTKVPGAVGGRDARKRGGKTKGKTNISINIMPQTGGAPMPPMGMNPPMPPAMPSVAPPAGAPPAGAPPMGGQGIDPSILAALASGMGGGAPAPVPAPAYKKGGRTAKQVGGPMNAGMIQQTRPMPAGGMINPIGRGPGPVPGNPGGGMVGKPAPRMIPGPNDFSMGPGGSLVRPGPGSGKPAPRMIPGPNDGIMGSLRPMPGAPGQLNNGTIPFPGSDRGPSRPFKKGGRANTKHVIDHASGGGLGRLEKIKAYGEPQKKIK